MTSVEWIENVQARTAAVDEFIERRYAAYAALAEGSRSARYRAWPVGDHARDVLKIELELITYGIEESQLDGLLAAAVQIENNGLTQAGWAYGQMTAAIRSEHVGAGQVSADDFARAIRQTDDGFSGAFARLAGAVIRLRRLAAAELRAIPSTMAAGWRRFMGDP